MENEEGKPVSGFRRFSNAIGMKSKRKLSISTDDERPTCCPEFVKKYVIRQGYMVKAPPIDKKNKMARWHMRWFVLYDTKDEANEAYPDSRQIMLYYFATHNHYISKETPKGAINLKDADIYPMTHCLHGYPFAIKICKDARTYYLCATQRRTRDDWLIALREHHIQRKFIDEDSNKKAIEEMNNLSAIDPVFTAPTKYLLNSWSTEKIDQIHSNSNQRRMTTTFEAPPFSQGKRRGSGQLVSKRNKRDSWIAELSYTMQHEVDETLDEDLFFENAPSRSKTLKLKPTYSLFPASLVEDEDLVLEDEKTKDASASCLDEVRYNRMTTERSNSTEETNNNSLFNSEDSNVKNMKKSKTISTKVGESIKRFLNEKKEKSKQISPTKIDQIQEKADEIVLNESDGFLSQLSQEDLGNIIEELTNPQSGRRFSSISDSASAMKKLSNLSEDDVAKIIRELMEPQKNINYVNYKESLSVTETEKDESVFVEKDENVFVEKDDNDDITELSRESFVKGTILESLFHDQSGDQPENKPIDQPENNSDHQAENESGHQPDNQPIDQPTNESGNQQENEQGDQAESQPGNLPENQPVNKQNNLNENELISSTEQSNISSDQITDEINENLKQIDLNETKPIVYENKFNENITCNNPINAECIENDNVKNNDTRTNKIDENENINICENIDNYKLQNNVIIKPENRKSKFLLEEELEENNIIKSQENRKSKFLLEEEFEEEPIKNDHRKLTRISRKDFKNIESNNKSEHDVEDSRNSMIFLNSQLDDIVQRSINTVDDSWDMGGWCAFQGPKFTIRRKKSQ